MGPLWSRNACILLILPIFGCSSPLLHSERGSTAESRGETVLAYNLPVTVFSIQIVEQASIPQAATPNGAELGAAGLMDRLSSKNNPVAGERPILRDNPNAPAPPSPPNAADPKLLRAASPDPAQAKYALYYSTRDVADPRHRYLAKYDASVFSDDKFDIGVTPDGLLNDLNASPTEHSTDFAKKIGELSAAAAQAAGGLFVATFKGQAPTTATVVLSITYDPSECDIMPCELPQMYRDSLTRYGYHLYFDTVRGAPAFIAYSGIAGSCGEGLCFRSKAPIRVVVEQKASAKTPVEAPAKNVGRALAAIVRDAPTEWVLEDDETVSIPNFSPIFGVGVSRSTGVQRTTIASISNGYQSKYDLTKASEAMSVIQVPIDVLKSIAGIVPAFWNGANTREQALDTLTNTRKTTFTDQQARTLALTTIPLDNQKIILQKQKDVIDAQALLDKAKLDAAAAVTKSP